ncbi:DNA repair helicase [Hesseltinella vesiculosa]|uniref:ATP-dependent DNA helicase CHL1 n=1 Tax=Hesseltinella vesiculosa TaxID=101127 RepID=A0A1X2GWE4_9FUNG|nr:DNA repair helicase [Hesseltinella vesiculosa]
MAIDFGFPYQPYDIQDEFMNSLYSVISQGKIGIFESPTGTGKSLSLICGSLKWLTDHGDQKDTSIPACNNEQDDGNDDEPDWLKNYQRVSKEQQEEQLRAERKSQLERLINDFRHGQQSRPSKAVDASARKRQKTSATKDTDDFMLDDYNSGDEGDLTSKKPIAPDTTSNLSSEVQQLLARLSEQNTKAKQPSPGPDNDQEQYEFHQQKIFYASRTHSQLTQFIHEVNKTRYKENIWTTPLGSRKNLCINKKVRTLDNVNRINEACLDMQKSKNESCPYLPSTNEQDRWTQFKVQALSKVQDIEDLCKLGEELHICPYYGGRHSSAPSQLVVLPYQHLLHARTRESLGINLKNNIVIIDEAHNLLETINAIHTVTVTLHQLQLALAQIRLYLETYASRLLGQNVVYIKQLIRIVKALARALEPKDAHSKKDCVLRVNEFAHTTDIDQVNLFKLEQYLDTSRLAQKLHGFYDKVRDQHLEAYKKALLTDKNAKKPPPLFTSASSISTLQQIQAFIMCLSHPDSHGRIVVSFSSEDAPHGPQLKYMLLNPADVFQPIVQEAKSIILAGGTMEPISDFVHGIFPTVSNERIHHFSCGHVIPSNHLLPLIVDKGPSGKPLVLNYNNRENGALIDEIGSALVNLCNVVPDGLVCFFSSFSYMDLVFKRWQVKTAGRSLFDRLAEKKKIFKEPKETSQVEAMLRDYALHIDQPKETKGAILFSVVNGKMSEGINFSDRLGRCVVMVGLPFPNRFSVELNEKIKYMDQQQTGKNLGKEYYENLCMRGVNQSIGRAIRHRNDYATIVLLDQRYNMPNIRKKLPSWIGDHVDHCDNLGKALGKISRFFYEKRSAPP